MIIKETFYDYVNSKPFEIDNARSDKIVVSIGSEIEIVLTDVKQLKSLHSEVHKALIELGELEVVKDEVTINKVREACNGVECERCVLYQMGNCMLEDAPITWNVNGIKDLLRGKKDE